MQLDLVSKHKRKLKDIQKTHTTNIAKLSGESVKATAAKVDTLEKKALKSGDKLCDRWLSAQRIIMPL